MQKAQLFVNKIAVKASDIHGYGVFAEKDIKAGEIIEECYALVSETNDSDLNSYYFDAKGRYSLALGFGSIYNHSTENNARYDYHDETKLIVFQALRKIRKGEEIFISYGDTWFSGRNLPIKKPLLIKRVLRYALGLPLRALLICGSVVALTHLLPH